MSCIKTQNYSFLTVTTFSQMFNTFSLNDEVWTGRPLVSVLYNITTFQNVVLTLVTGRRSDGVNVTRQIKMRVQVADEKIQRRDLRGAGSCLQLCTVLSIGI